MKRVYYCDFCRKHSLRPLTQHEERCTANPDRECHWSQGAFSGVHMGPGELRPVIEWCKGLPKLTPELIAVLRKKVERCPACMLAVLRQSRTDEWHYVDGQIIFDYKQEVERFNSEDNRLAEMRAMYG